MYKIKPRTGKKTRINNQARVLEGSSFSKKITIAIKIMVIVKRKVNIS
jgi:hypothetical protein